MLKARNLIIVILVALTAPFSHGQITGGKSDVDYLSPKEYTIANIKVDGNITVEDNSIILLSGLASGQNVLIPGDDISQAVKKLWDQNIFNDVQIIQEKIVGEFIYLLIKVNERPRLSRFRFEGVSKTEADDIRELIDLYSGKIVTENLKNTTTDHVRNFFIDKGFLKAKVKVESETDSIMTNSVMLTYTVKQGKKIKINDITFSEGLPVKEGKLLRAMKETKKKRWWWVFKRSKFIQSQYKEDKQNVLAVFKEMGYRDAKIESDSIWDHDAKTINIHLNIDPGHKYYFGDISWVGNTKYRDGQLDTLLGIKKGDVYNESLLQRRLFMSPDGRDVSSLYMDRGYLFFQLQPIEVSVDGDSINYEMQMYEGKQARVKNVIVKGNSKTNDHVIYREIRTRPGDLFSRNDIIRTQRELSNLGYFDPEKFNVNPRPNPADGTVDIEYTVEERPSDQIELSGGWGGGRIVGTLGLTFNNFSVKNFFKKEAWQPLPTGDGQRLSIRAQSNGLFFQSYNLSFTEPWLGGKRPNALSVSGYHSVQSNGVRKGEDGRRSLSITGGAVGLGKRNRWPDDYFTTYMEAGYQRYHVKNWGSIFVLDSGVSQSPYINFKLSRNSINKPIYTEEGAQISLSIKATPPWSWFDGNGPEDYAGMTPQQKYRLIEYNKWKFTASWFTPLSGKNRERKFVLNTRVGFGFLNYYTKALGPAPFERFYLGGSGLTGFNLDGREIIALRGYPDQAISPQQGGILISKYTMELRYPISTNPQATVFMLGFLEGGNTWQEFKNFNPFQVKRSAGIGVRIFLPMFGLMGLDYGWGFDPLTAPTNSQTLPIQKTGQFHFTIGMNLGEL